MFHKHEVSPSNLLKNKLELLFIRLYNIKILPGVSPGIIKEVDLLVKTFTF